MKKFILIISDKTVLKKVLITGNTGFLGTHLVKSFKTKYDLIGLSDNSKKQQITGIKKDIRKVSLNDVPKDIYCIIHLAALTDVFYCQSNPSECFEINTKGTQNMLEIARKRKSKFIFLSTSHVYGIPKKLPIQENHPRNPISIYSSSKFAAEIICESYSKVFDMEISILRLFSVYGPSSPHHQVITKMISHLSSQKKLHLGNIFPKRDFIYISDVINAIELVMKKSHGFNVFNIGTGKSYSIEQIFKFLTKILQQDIEIVSDKSKMRKIEVNDVRASSLKLRKLGWSPRISIHDGLEMTAKKFVMEQ